MWLWGYSCECAQPARAETLTACEDPDGYFDFGVDLFVAGVERPRAARRRQNRKA